MCSFTLLGSVMATPTSPLPLWKRVTERLFFYSSTLYALTLRGSSQKVRMLMGESGLFLRCPSWFSFPVITTTLDFLYSPWSWPNHLLQNLHLFFNLQIFSRFDLSCVTCRVVHGLNMVPSSRSSLGQTQGIKIIRGLMFTFQNTTVGQLGWDPPDPML